MANAIVVAAAFVIVHLPITNGGGFIDIVAVATNAVVGAVRPKLTNSDNNLSPLHQNISHP